MASITCCGTCVPPGPSRKTAGCPLTVCASAGNCERTQARSSATDEDKEEACSAIGIADILIEEAEVDAGAGGMNAAVIDTRSLMNVHGNWVVLRYLYQLTHLPNDEAL